MYLDGESERRAPNRSLEEGMAEAPDAFRDVDDRIRASLAGGRLGELVQSHAARRAPPPPAVVRIRVPKIRQGED